SDAAAGLSQCSKKCFPEGPADLLVLRCIGMCEGASVTVHQPGLTVSKAFPPAGPHFRAAHRELSNCLRFWRHQGTVLCSVIQPCARAREDLVIVKGCRLRLASANHMRNPCWDPY